MNATKPKVKVGCKNPKGSQQRVGRRAGRRVTVSKKRWWWVEYRWNGTPSEVRANTLTEALTAARDRAEWKQVTDIVVTEVEVVERRKTVEQLKPGSPTE